MAALLSIIIVNYRTPQLLVNCLKSIYDDPVLEESEIIIVDNASADDSYTVISSAYPNVKWIQMSYNSGFARANNEGIRQASGSIVLLLNSDTLNANGAIGNCYHLFLNSSYVACGVQLLNKDGSPQISGNYFMRGSLNNLLPLPYTGSFIKWIGGLFKIKKPHVPDADTIVEVDWINGAFLMVKKPAIDQAGLMDEDFFLYAEEAEWCSRLGKTGKQCIYGQFKVIHLQGESANASFGSTGLGYYNLYDQKGLQIMLSNFVRIRKQFGTGWLIIHLLTYTFTIPVFVFCSFIQNGLTGKNPMAQFESVKKFACNVLILWRFSPKIMNNKPYFYKILQS